MKWPVSREEEEGPGLTTESWLCNNFLMSSIRGSLRDGGCEDCSILNMMGSESGAQLIFLSLSRVIDTQVDPDLGDDAWKSTFGGEPGFLVLYPAV